MRVVAGERRGFQLIVPKHGLVRPTEDRVKESLFNILAPLKPHATVLDLFSCSGSIGIEFLSRGAKRCVFVDIDFRSIEAIRSNVEKTRYTDRSEILRGHFETVLRRLAKDGNAFDYIYLDPPYRTDFLRKSMEMIHHLQLLAGDGIIVAESENTSEEEPDAPFEKVDRRKYGKTVLSFYEVRVESL